MDQEPRKAQTLDVEAMRDAVKRVAPERSTAAKETSDAGPGTLLKRALVESKKAKQLLRD